MSLLSDLNDKIKRLSTRVAAEFKTQQSAIDSKVSTVNGIAPDENGNVEISAGSDAYVEKSGDTMTGTLRVPYLQVAGGDTAIEGGELLLEAANETLYALKVDNYNNQFRVIYVASDGTVGGVFHVYSTGRIELPNNTAFWIA